VEKPRLKRALLRPMEAENKFSKGSKKGVLNWVRQTSKKLPPKQMCVFKNAQKDQKGHASEKLKSKTP